MWILLEFFNDYDQHGGYFAGVFDSYDLAKAAAGELGRKGSDYSWYRAVEVDTNKVVGVIDESEMKLYQS